jgi:hypothetical protein
MAQLEDAYTFEGQALFVGRSIAHFLITDIIPAARERLGNDGRRASVRLLFSRRSVAAIAAHPAGTMLPLRPADRNVLPIELAGRGSHTT